MKRLLKTTLKVLSLTFKQEDLKFDRSTLIFGLICTWVAGVGRYWDHPDAEILQYLGVGSVIYVFALSFILWLLLWPLRLKNLNYIHLLTLITLTSPPAILYAIPVERFMSLNAAQSINVWFLAIVAIWRVSIYLRYLKIQLQANYATVLIIGFLPLCGIVFTLTILNLEKAVFEIMGGLDPALRTSNDTAYEVLFGLTYLSVTLAPILLVCYLVAIATAQIQHFRAKKNAPNKLPKNQ